jgi:ribosomal protein S18 acetylase RimI-like enzyme
MIFKKASLGDLQALLEIENASFCQKDSPLNIRTMGYHLKLGRIVGAYENENLLGYILIFPRKIPRIYSIATHPKARGKGVAKNLIQHALHVNQNLRLEVRDDNKSAISLYEKLGFTCKGAKKAFYPDGCDARVYYFISK